ncbi:MAG: 7-cyano-7-deazaguanine synthase [archaeon]
MKKKQAIILCSGGIDSTVTAHLVKKRMKYSKIAVLFFNYGQKSIKMERNCAKYVAKSIKSGFKEVSLPELHNLSTSLINIPGKHKSISKSNLKDTRNESKTWYVPSRNTLFLAYASALAEKGFIQYGIKSDIFVGFKCEGNDSYPDSTPSFVEKINSLFAKSLVYPVKVMAPLIKLDKEDIILLGKRLGVNFRKTFSCYIGKNKPCRSCLSCKLREAGFYWAGLEDK